MIIHDHFDALLTETLTTGTTGGETLESEIIDLTETGASEASQLVLTAPAADQSLTLKVLACAEKDGEFVEALSFTTEADTDFEYRERVPLHLPQYIKLQVVTDGTAPSEPVAVTLRLAV